MRSISLILILFLLSFNSFAQTPTTLDAVLDSLYQKADARNVDLKTLVKKYVRNIYIVDSLPRSKWNTEVIGRAVPLTNHQTNVYVIKDMFTDFYTAERVLIHEIAHALGIRGHCCEDVYCVYIMAKEQATNPEHILYFIAFKTYEYEIAFDNLFYQIDRLHFNKELPPIPLCRQNSGNH